MSSKFAKAVQDAQSELLEQAGNVALTPEEVEGVMRFAATSDPNTLKSFDTQKGDAYVNSLVGAYRATQQQATGAAQADPNNPQADPNNPQAAPQATAQQGQPAPAPTQTGAPVAATPQTASM